MELKSLLPEDHEELALLFPGYKEYMQKIPFGVYDIREILCEKVRSILTRDGVKTRDFLDVYLICKKFGIKLEDVHECIVGKTQFMLNLYAKYRKNLAAKRDIVTSGTLTWGEERGLLLQEIDDKEFFRFLGDLRVFLKKVIDELVKEL